MFLEEINILPPLTDHRLQKGKIRNTNKVKKKEYLLEMLKQAKGLNIVSNIIFISFIGLKIFSYSANKSH